MTLGKAAKMDIAAYFAACEIEDLDHYAKDVVRTVAGRMDRKTGEVHLPLQRLALDMGVSKQTAMRAANRAEKAGYLVIHRRTRQAASWALNPSNLFPNTGTEAKSHDPPSVPSRGTDYSPNEEQSVPTEEHIIDNLDFLEKAARARTRGEDLDPPPDSQKKHSQSKGESVKDAASRSLVLAELGKSMMRENGESRVSPNHPTAIAKRISSLENALAAIRLSEEPDEDTAREIESELAELKAGK